MHYKNRRKNIRTPCLPAEAVSTMASSSERDLRNPSRQLVLRQRMDNIRQKMSLKKDMDLGAAIENGSMQKPASSRKDTFGREQTEPEKERDSSTDDRSLSDCSSIFVDHGDWDGNYDPWYGCVCNEVHPRPTVVFWLQCDGACHGWYNVSVNCVGFDDEQAKKMVSWFCRDCSNMAPQLRLLLDLPDVLLHHILSFVAPAMERAAVLSLQIAPLCDATLHAVHNEPWSSLWFLLLQNEYGGGLHPARRLASTTGRASKRLRSEFQARTVVRETHIMLCENTDDAHCALMATAVNEYEPLTLKRLRSIMSEHGRPSLLVNRRSPWGRTFLMECCAADFVDEGVVLRCVRELVENHGAGPNVLTRNEHPFADRPVLFFAIARVMPSVVEYLIHAGASLHVEVTGQFRLVSAPLEGLHGTFTPLGFARALKDAESRLPVYYVSKLNVCIKILSKAEEKESHNLNAKNVLKRQNFHQKAAALLK